MGLPFRGVKTLFLLIKEPHFHCLHLEHHICEWEWLNKSRKAQAFTHA